MRNMFLNISLILIVMMMFSSCGKNSLCEDDELSLTRVNYSGSPLKINGYYFGEPNSRDNVKIHYLYENGVYFDGGLEPLKEAQNSSFQIDIANEFPRRVKSAWGVFQVNGNTIEIERWRPRPNGCETTIYERGEILNEVTFVITRREHRTKGRVKLTETPNSTFSFRPLTQKPDSTNNFIQ